jgi:hypothetical protein
MIEEKRLENGHPYLEVINALDDARRLAPGAEYTLGVTISSGTESC